MENLSAGYNGLTILAMLIATMGVLLALSVVAFTIYHRDHRVVKSSGRELSLMMWIGVMVNHLNTFLVFFTAPGHGICSLLRYVSLFS